MFESILLVLGAIGWVTSVLGAVLGHRRAAKLTEHVDEGTFSISTSERHSRWGLTLVVVGASAGGIGTILAVLTST